MILSYDSLIKLKEQGYGVIDAPEDAYQAASIDVTLGTSVKRFFRDQNQYIIIPGETELKYRDVDPVRRAGDDKLFFQLEPQDFVLATTKETIKLHDGIGAWIEGRSSIGRTGIFIQNAGWINPGFEGQITLEIYNANFFPIYIYSGMGIGQIIIEQLDSNTSKPYKGKYNNQTNATPPIL